MQTRKRRLESKIDREIGTELLDAKIKYSQNKILLRYIQKLVSWLTKHLKKDTIHCLTNKFLMQKESISKLN